MDLKVILADDEKGMRLILNKILSKAEGFEVIGEAENGNEALRLIESNKPDVVFLDIQMPGLNGVECAKRLIDIDPRIFIIFATAHQEYMPEAFEVYAFDYLVKPFNLERVDKTLKRIRQSRNHAYDPSPAYTGKKEKYISDKLVIRNRDGMSFIDTGEIILIRRENRNTVIHTASEDYVVSESLTDLEKRLDAGTFFRSHKSYIINVGLIHKIYPYGRWTYLVKFKNTETDALLTHEKNEYLQGMFK